MENHTAELAAQANGVTALSVSPASTPDIHGDVQGHSPWQPQSTSSLPWPPFLVGQIARPVRVVLIDDDANIRHVISSELMADRRCDLVGQGASMREGRRLISTTEFDVMLVDLNLGDGNGFELIEHLINPLRMVRK